MPSILHIETSTTVCSVVLTNHGKVIAERISLTGPSHASLLGVFVREIQEETNVRPDAVAVSCGPGSYTGLRIGVSMAKGLCYGWNVPLIAVDTLRLLASIARETIHPAENDLLCPMIDARRMEVYSAFYTASLEVTRPTAADIVDEYSYADKLAQHRVFFFGNGADKCRSTITHSNAVFVDDIVPIASGMIALAEEAYASRMFEDVAYFEPFYLKEFVATVPRNKVLNGL